MTSGVDTIARRVFRIAKDDPLREAVVDASLRYSYRDLAQIIEASSEALLLAGLRPGFRAAFLGMPGAPFIASTLAVQNAGGVWMGINPKYTHDEIAYALRDGEPSIIFAEARAGEAAIGRLTAAARTLQRVPPIVIVESTRDLVDDLPPCISPAQVLVHEIGLLVYTSGTTGEPKGACLTHRGIVAAADLYAERYAHPNLRSLLNLPVNHVGSLIDLTASALVMGGTLIAMPEFDPVAIPEIMEMERITLLGQVPAMHLAIEAATGYDPADIASLKHLVWSGAAMPESWIRAHYGKGIELSTCYGQTECTGSVTFTSPDADIHTLAASIGRPARPQEFRIVPIEPGDPAGEIQVRGDMMMHGYLGRRSATAEAMTRDGWLRTGDLGEMHDDGNIQIVGRLKEMYKSGGYNIYPREVEIALEAHQAVQAAAVVSMPDPHWQEVGWAFVIAKEDVATEELLSFARARLANFKLPKRLFIGQSFPLLPIGKIDKRALKAAAEAGEYA